MLTYSVHVFILNVERLTSLIVNTVCYESRIKIMIECHVRSLNGVIFERPAITIFGCKVTKIGTCKQNSRSGIEKGGRSLDNYILGMSR